MDVTGAEGGGLRGTLRLVDGAARGVGGVESPGSTKDHPWRKSIPVEGSRHSRHEVLAMTGVFRLSVRFPPCNSKD